MTNVTVDLSEKQINEAEAVHNEVGNVVLDRQQLTDLGVKLFGKKYALNWVRKMGDINRVKRGIYVVPQSNGEIVMPDDAELKSNTSKESGTKAKTATKSETEAETEVETEAEAEVEEEYNYQVQTASKQPAKQPAKKKTTGKKETPGNENTVSRVEEGGTGPRVMGIDYNITYVPSKDKLYVPFGNHKKVKTVLNSGLFYPLFITGLSGNGKTSMVEQVAAELDRELFRVNITSETDEDDLLGGMRLVNGDTVFQYGPVVEAMKRGAVLLLDEVDLGGSKLMALQPVLEGKGVYLKKVNEFVEPAEGFTIVATANTKGKGSENGQFAFTNVLNEAFLDRFPATMFQPYPSKAQEKKVLRKILKSVDVTGDDAKDFIEKMVKWAQGIRKLYEEDGCEEIITTRRLVNIGTAYSMFGDRMEAIKLCIERFDQETRTQFLDYYKKIDETVDSENDSDDNSGDDAEDFDDSDLN